MIFCQCDQFYYLVLGKLTWNGTHALQVLDFSLRASFCKIDDTIENIIIQTHLAFFV